MREAADRIAHFADELAKSHTVDGIVKDLDVQLMLESDADLIDAMRTSALPWDQRHKQPVNDTFMEKLTGLPNHTLGELLSGSWLKPTDSMGMPISCGKPLCSPGDHHPLCKLAAQPAPDQGPVSGVVLREGSPTLLRDSEIKETDVRLCVNQPTPVQEPLFWYRTRPDGGYEGPIHDDWIDDARRNSGVWVPLVPMGTPPDQREVGQQTGEA